MPSDIIEAVKLVLEQLKDFRAESRLKKEEKYLAIEAIQLAANRTKYYYSTLDGEEQPNLDLSEYWMKAAEAVRKLDVDLYQRLLMKAGFWANPKSWDRNSISKLNIQLDSILEATYSMLNNL